MGKKKTNFSVRLDPLTRNLLGKLAEVEQRTAGGYLRALIVRQSIEAGIFKSPADTPREVSHVQTAAA